MLTRSIPSTGEALPVIGLGTWRTFDVDMDTAALAPRRKVLETLLAAGGSVVDSSPMYGRAEAVVGALLADIGARDRAFVATKVWTTGESAGIAQMEQSFDRLLPQPTTPARPDAARRLDLMQIHNLLDWRTHMRTLRARQAEGRFRYIGITHYTTAALDDLAAVISREKIDFVQLAYSIGVRDAEHRLLPLAADRGVAVLVNRPFDSGSAFGAGSRKPLPAWSGELGCTSWAQLMLKYILAHPAVTCVIPGTADPAHMRDNIAAGEGPLPDADQRRRLIELWEAA